MMLPEPDRFSQDDLVMSPSTIMRIDDADVRDLGLDLKHTPSSTELRLPSAIGCVNGAGLGFFGLVALLFSAFLVWTAWKEAGRSFVPIAISSTIAIGLLLLIHRVSRWLQYGAVVRVTPDRLVIKKHWSGGEAPIAIALDQVRLEPARRGIVVAGGRLTMKIGTGLPAEARDSVAGFLDRVIAGHLGADAGRPAEVAPTAGPVAIPPEDVIAIAAGITMGPAADDGAPSLERPPVDGPAAEDESFEPDLLLLALSRRCHQADSGGVPRVHMAPHIPPAMLYAALESFLEIRDDEVLLGIVGAPAKARPGRGCALTTRRIYWAGKPAPSPGGRPPRCRWLDYSSMPEAIDVGGAIMPTVILGKGKRIGVATGARGLARALAAFLRAARSLAIGAPADLAATEAAGLVPRGASAPFLRGEGAVPVTVESEMAAARRAWPRVVAASREARGHQVEIREFQGRFLASRAIVTPAIVGICIVVYALTVAAAMGQQPGQPWPDSRVMLAWGADFGPSTLIDGEVWRMFTNLFLHWGILHLLLNMYCLATAGPIVERLFGHVGFAGLYVLSGLGGSIASLCYHPTVISAGASGAIFGVFGALLGFLLIRENEIPEAKFRPMAGGALAFLGYNLVFGLGAEGIDMAAHLGGLAVGLVCGLLLTAATPGRAAAAGRRRPALGRAAVLLACSAMFALSWPKASEYARGRIRDDPKMGPRIDSQRAAVEAWNTYMGAVRSLLLDFDRISERLDDTLRDADAGRLDDDAVARAISRLKGDCERLGTRLGGVPIGNEEIREIHRHLTSAQAMQIRMLTAVEQLVETGDQARFRGPEGLAASSEAYVKEFGEFKRRRDAYFQEHSMQVVKDKP